MRYACGQVGQWDQAFAGVSMRRLPDHPSVSIAMYTCAALCIYS